MLLELPAPGGSFVDLGCGSGVLAIAAARLGYQPVLALDNDPASVQATADNAAVNGVDLEVRRFDLRSEDVPPAETVTANLLGPLLRAWAPRLAAAPARLIASGLLVAEADGIAEAFAGVGLREADRRESGEWGALLLERT
jgi:ribosomal protein L11 methyltransferase